MIWWQHGDTISSWLTSYRETRDIVARSDRIVAENEAEIAAIETDMAEKDAEERGRTQAALAATSQGRSPEFAVAYYDLDRMNLDEKTSQICNDILRGLEAFHRPGPYPTLDQTQADAVMARVTANYPNERAKITQCGQIVENLGSIRILSGAR